jgi:uncharacterized protein
MIADVENPMKNANNYEKSLKLTEAESADSDEILELLESAAADGDYRAIYARASCYVDGKFGSVIDQKKANKMFLSLKSSELPEALFALAYMYDVGDGVRADSNQAFSYYMRAALLGHLEACLQVSEFYREGKDVKQDAKLAIAWRKRSKSQESLISPPWRIWLL